jgi:hypothetical protein
MRPRRAGESGGQLLFKPGYAREAQRPQDLAQAGDVIAVTEVIFEIYPA